MWLVCSVLYISIHRADIFPAGDSGYVNKVGLQQGAGFNINIPWLKVHLFYLPWSCIAGLRLQNDLYCGEWGVKLYSNQPTITFSFIIQYRIVAWVHCAAQIHQFPERPTLHHISSLMYPKIQQRQVIMNFLRPTCAWPPWWLPQILWRWCEDSLACILGLIKMFGNVY